MEEADGELGEAETVKNRRRRSMVAEEEDEDTSDEAEPSGSFPSAWGRGDRWRSFWSRSRGEGRPVDVVAASGGDSGVRSRERKGGRGRDEHERD